MRSSPRTEMHWHNPAATGVGTGAAACGVGVGDGAGNGLGCAKAAEAAARHAARSITSVAESAPRRIADRRRTRSIARR